MPLSRYQIRNEFSLADPELYRAADKDDPEALLEGVAMAGLVGVLRQLGDLAEFAAEIFHDLHEEVMATAARGHSLTIRVQQLEAELPSLEKAFLSQTSCSSFFYNPGTDWHPNLRMDQNMVTQGDLPRFVMDSYEECRGPPRLFLLDKFDVAGAGACLKRYTDPSFFKEGASSFEMTNTDFQREKKTRKAKKKGSRWRNGETPEVLPTSHAKLHQLFLEEERVENGTKDSGRRVKLKRRLNGFPFDLKTGKSYMEKFLTNSPEHKVVHEVSVDSSPLKLPASSAYETGLDYVQSNSACADEEPTQKISLSASLSPSQSEASDAIKQQNDAMVEAVADDVVTCSRSFEAGDNLPTSHKVATENEILNDGEDKREDSTTGYHSDDIVSEIENYADALASMDSELDTDSELRARTSSHFLNREKYLSTNDDQIQSQSSDSQSIGHSTLSDDANSTSKKEVSSFSSSGCPSTSAETAPLEGDTATMTEIRDIQMCYSPVDLRSIDKGVASAQSSEQVGSSEASIEASEHHTQSYDLEPLSTSSLLEAALIPGTNEAGTVMGEDDLMEPAISEKSSNLDEDENHSTSVAEASVNQDMNVCAAIYVDASNQTGGDLTPVMSDDNQLLDEIHTADLNVSKNITSSAIHSNPSDNGDYLPASLSAEDHNTDNSALDHLNLSDDMYISSNPFLDKLDGETPDSLNNRCSFDNLSNHLTSSKVDYPPSCTSNYSNDELDYEDRNISSGASVHPPDILEVSSEEECVKNDLCIASKEEDDEDNGIEISEDLTDSASKTQTAFTSVDETLVSEEENAEDNCTTVSDGHICSSNIPVVETVPEDSGMPCGILPLGTEEVADSPSWQADLDEALSMTDAGIMVPNIPGPDVVENDTSLSPCLDSTSVEPAVLHARVTEADELNANGGAVSPASPDEHTGGVSASSLDIKELQDDPQESGASNEIGHHTVTTPDLQSEATQLHLEESSFNVEQESSPRSSFRDDMGYALPSQNHLCAEQEAELPRDQFDNEMLLDSGNTNSELPTPLEQELSCQSDPAGLLDDSSKSLLANDPVQVHLPEEKCEDAEQKTETARNQLGKEEELMVVDQDNSLPLPQLEQRQLSYHTEFERFVDPSIHVTEVPSQRSFPEPLPQDNHDDASSLSTLDCVEVNAKLTCNEIEKEEPVHEGEEISELSSKLAKVQVSGNVHQGSLDDSPKTMPKDLPFNPSVLENLPNGNSSIDLSEEYKNPFTFIPPSVGLYPGADQINLEEMPPLPPLPPAQWILGKFPRASPFQGREVVQNETASLPCFPSMSDRTVQPSEKSLPPLAVTGSFSQVTPVDKASSTAFGTSSDKLPLLAKQETEDASLKRQEMEKDFTNSERNLATIVSLEDSGSLHASQSPDGTLVTSMKEAEIDDVSTDLEDNSVKEKELNQPEHQVESEMSMKELKLDIGSSSSEVNLVTNDTTPSGNELIQPEHHLAPETSSNELEPDSKLTQPDHQVTPEINTNELECEKVNAHVEENRLRFDSVQSALEKDLQKPLQDKPSSEEDIIWPAVEDGMVYGNKKMKLPRPRSPLIDAVAAHDKSKLRKVSDRVKPPVQKVDERDMLLEQIRNKSFNLKPTVVTRPNIQAPQTNLKYAAILEKAKAIREAFAGSDEDEDEDSWE